MTREPYQSGPPLSQRTWTVLGALGLVAAGFLAGQATGHDDGARVRTVIEREAPVSQDEELDPCDVGAPSCRADDLPIGRP